MGGGEVRLRFAYVLRCEEAIKDDDGKKVKGIIHWLSEYYCARATVRLYDRLFNAPSPGAEHEDGDFLKDVNPDSLQVLENVPIERYVADSPPGARVQFERSGYFCVDKES